MGILLVYDVTDEASFNNIRNWMKNIEQHASDNVVKVRRMGWGQEKRDVCRVGSGGRGGASELQSPCWRWRTACLCLLLLMAATTAAFLSPCPQLPSFLPPLASKQVLVGNKSDMDESKRAVPYSRGQALADEFKMAFFETSAKANTNVDETFQVRLAARGRDWGGFRVWQLGGAVGEGSAAVDAGTSVCMEGRLLSPSSHCRPNHLHCLPSHTYNRAVGGAGHHGAAQGHSARCQQQRRQRPQPAGWGRAAQGSSQQQGRLLLSAAAGAPARTGTGREAAPLRAAAPCWAPPCILHLSACSFPFRFFDSL